MISGFVVTNTTTPAHLDSFFTQLWKRNEKVKLMIDASQCSNISVRKVLSLKGVLDKHRHESSEKIEFSVIFVRSKFIRNIIRLGLGVIKSERPVYVETLKIKST